MPVMRNLSIPTLWVRPDHDRDSPDRITQVRLAMLQKEGKPIEVVTFPDTNHGVLEYVQAPDGSRTYTRVAEGFFRLMADWIKGRLSPPYGRAQFRPPLS